MRYLAFPGWMMTLSKREDEYLNPWVILFRLQHEIHSLQMHPKSPCRSVVATTPKLSERRYALRLVVFSCQYFPSPSPSFQPILPSLSYHISSVAVPRILLRRIHICCPASPPLWSSAAVFDADLVYYPHYPGATICPRVVSFSLSIFSQSVAILPTHFTISVIPHLICCRPISPPPPCPSLLSHISSTVLFRHCLHRWPCLPSLLHFISTAPPLLSSHVSVVVLITLSSIVPCTSPPLFVYLLRSDILLAMRFYVLHCLLRSAPHWFSHSPLWYSHYTFPFYFVTSILSLRDVLAPLQSAAFFSTCLHSNLLQSDHSPKLYLLRSACFVSDMLNSDFSSRSLIFLLQLALIRSLRSALSLVLLDLLIYLKITYRYVTHYLLLACSIT